MSSLLAGPLLLVIVGLAGVLGEQGAMRAPAWQGVNRVVVVCDVTWPADLGRCFCDLAIAEARRGASIPISADLPSVPHRDDAIVRLHVAGPHAAGSRSTLLVSMQRGIVVDDAEGADGDALAIRPIMLSGTDDVGLAAGVATAFDRVLPWRRPHYQGVARSRRP